MIGSNKLKAWAIDAGLTGQTIYYKQCGCAVCRSSRWVRFSIRGDGPESASDFTVRFAIQLPVTNKWMPIPVEDVLALIEERSND